MYILSLKNYPVSVTPPLYQHTHRKFHLRLVTGIKNYSEHSESSLSSICVGLELLLPKT